MGLAQDSAVSEGWNQCFCIFGCLLLEGMLVRANLHKLLGALGVAVALACPGSAPTWPVSLLVGTTGRALK